MTFQIHAVIFTQKNEPSTGRVCPTARFEKRTLENKGGNEGHPLEKRRFCPRIAKDGLNLRSVSWWLCERISFIFAGAAA